MEIFPGFGKGKYFTISTGGNGHHRGMMLLAFFGREKYIGRGGGGGGKTVAPISDVARRAEKK